MEVWQVKPARRFSEELVWVSTQSPGELAASRVWSQQFCTNDAFHMLAGRFRRTSYHKLLAPFLAVIILYSLFT